MKLIKGDCLEKMKGIPDKSVDLIICDLPYGMTDCKWDSVLDFDLLWEQYRRILKPFGVCILFGAEPFMSQVITSNLKEYSHQWYWKKKNKTGGLFARRQPMRCVEEIAVFICNAGGQKLRGHAPTYNPQGVVELEKPRYKKETGGGNQVYGQVTPKVHKQTKTGYPCHILEIPRDKAIVHPTQKPVELLRYLIRTYSNRGETVMDNCMGSGSTGIAAALEGRDFIGIELDDKYFEIAKERIEEAGAE